MADKRVLKEVGKEVAKGIGKMIGYVYIAPTIVRIETWYDEPYGAFAPMAFSSVYGGLIHLFGTFISSSLKADNLAKLILINGGLLVATNVASGVYEYLRALYEEKKKYSPSSTPSISPSSPSAAPLSSPQISPLEEKIGEQDKKPESRITNIPNPWNIDIPKIEDKKVARNY